jgi:hypothetical protein
MYRSHPEFATATGLLVVAKSAPKSPNEGPRAGRTLKMLCSSTGAIYLLNQSIPWSGEYFTDRFSTFELNQISFLPD